MKKLTTAAAVLASTLALCSCQQGSGSSKESGNFEGETIELVVPFDPGGGYDSYARQLAPELADELGAKIVVVNKPGAGGLIALNGLSTADNDGTTIEILNMTGTIGSALAEAEGVQYEPEKFSYIGQIGSEPDLVIARSDGDISSYDDLVAAAGSGPVRFAATGPGSNEYVDPLVLDEALDIDSEVVTGFGGSGEAALALLQGNVEAYSRSLSSQLPTIESGDAVPILVLGSDRLEEFPDVPTVLEEAPDEEQKAILQYHVDLLESGRTIAAPPDMDEKRLAELRAAFAKVVQDADFIAAGEQAGRPITYLSGEDVQAEVEGLVDAPASYIDILKAAYSGQ
jgi:tripartite-type tricarboxylate transporter receptor subunit TctC